MDPPIWTSMCRAFVNGKICILEPTVVKAWHAEQALFEAMAAAPG